MKINFFPGQNWLTLLRNAEDGNGGGAGDPGAAGGAGGEASPDGSAGAEGDAPAPSFLSEAQKAAAGENPPPEEKKEEAKPDGEAKTEEPPAAFDLTAVKLPEGVTLSEELGKSLADVLNNVELSPQDRGQQLLDLHLKALGETQASLEASFKEASKTAWTTMNDQWRAQIKDLPEFKANPDVEAGKVLQALIAVGADEKFFAAMDLTGAGNHPAVMQVLHRLTKPFIEGGSVNGDNKPVAPRQLGGNIYTSTQPKE